MRIFHPAAAENVNIQHEIVAYYSYSMDIWTRMNNHPE